MFNLLIILPFLVTFHVSVFLLFCVCKKKPKKVVFTQPYFSLVWHLAKLDITLLLLALVLLLLSMQKWKVPPTLSSIFPPLFGSSFPFSDSKLSFSALTMLTQFQTIFYLSDNQTDIYPIWYFYFFSFLFLQFSRDGVITSQLYHNDWRLYLFSYWFMIFFIPGCWQKFILFQIRLYLHISVVH